MSLQSQVGSLPSRWSGGHSQEQNLPRGSGSGHGHTSAGRPLKQPALWSTGECSFGQVARCRRCPCTLLHSGIGRSRHSNQEDLGEPSCSSSRHVGAAPSGHAVHWSPVVGRCAWQSRDGDDGGAHVEPSRLLAVQGCDKPRFAFLTTGGILVPPALHQVLLHQVVGVAVVDG